MGHTAFFTDLDARSISPFDRTVTGAAPLNETARDVVTFGSVGIETVGTARASGGASGGGGAPPSLGIGLTTGPTPTSTVAAGRGAGVGAAFFEGVLFATPQTRSQVAARNLTFNIVTRVDAVLDVRVNLGQPMPTFQGRGRVGIEAFSTADTGLRARA